MALNLKLIAYLLGLFSTIQIMTFANVTIFNYLLMAIVVLFFFQIKKIIKLDYFFIFSFILTFITYFLSVLSEQLSKGFITSAINSGVVYLLCLFVYIIFKNKSQLSFFFYKGFILSCYLTLFWCVLQIVSFYLFNINLNVLVFYDLLTIPYMQSYDSSFYPTGFYLHRAILIPIFLFLFFSSRNFWVICLVTIISLLSKSTTLIILLFLSFIFLYKKQIIKFCRYRSKKIIEYSIFCILVVLVTFLFTSYIQDVVCYVLERIFDSTSNKADNSSVVHYLYYYNFASVIDNINILNKVFGSGFGTSGFFYTLFNGQYKDMSNWIVESDYINILINQGILGFIVFYFFLIRLCVISHTKKFNNAFFFFIIILFAGFFYNLQFNWFIIVEFSLYFLIKHNIDPFGLNKSV